MKFPILMVILNAHAMNLLSQAAVDGFTNKPGAGIIKTPSTNIGTSSVTDFEHSNEQATYQHDSSLTSFSALPATIGQLLGEFQYGTVTLSWKIFAVQTGTYSIIERSLDGQKFEQISIADMGSLSADHSLYQFKDKNPLPNAYYRIRIAGDGVTEAFSNVVNLTNPAFVPVVSVKPVSFADWISVDIDCRQPSSYLINVKDFSGITVYKKEVSIGAGLNTIRLEERIADLISGLYLVEVSTGDFSYKQNLIKK